MKKYLSILLILILSLSLFTGCQDSSSDGGDVSGTVVMPVSGVEVEKAVMPREELEINFLTVRMGITEAYMAEMEKLTGFENYNIIPVFDPDALQTQTVSMNAGGVNPYQVMSMASGNYGLFSDNDWLYDLTPFIEKYGELYNLDDIPESLWEGVTKDGKIYGIPATTNMYQLFYREDILTEEGIDVPTTYDGLIDALDQLQDSGYDYPYISAFTQPFGIENEFVQMMNAIGGEIFDSETNAPQFNTPDGLEAMEKLEELYSYMNPDVITYNSDDLTVEFQTGGSVFAKTWATRATNFEDTTVSEIAGNVGYSPSVRIEEDMPLFSFVTSDYFIIPYNITDDATAEAAFLAIMEATCAPAQERAGGVSMVSRASSLTEENLAAAPQYAAMLEATELGLAPHTAIAFPFYNQAMGVVGPYLNDAMAGNISFEEALEKCDEDVTVLLQDLGYME